MHSADDVDFVTLTWRNDCFPSQWTKQSVIDKVQFYIASMNETTCHLFMLPCGSVHCCTHEEVRLWYYICICL